MTPGNFMGGYAIVGVVGDDYVAVDYVNSDGGVRPVVSLKSDAITGGDGTMNNPFTVG